MGVQHWGAFGGFQNKTGALVGRRVNGQNVISAVPHPSQKPSSTGQKNQRAKFKTVVSFLRRFTGLVRVGFQNAHKQKQSAFNAAFVYNYQNAVKGVAPNYTIDYPKFSFSQGNLSKPFHISYTIDAPANIKFNWGDHLNTGIGKPDDTITIVAYSPVLDESVVAPGFSARSNLAFELRMPPHFSGEIVHVWVSMTSADGKMASDCTHFANVELL